MQHVLRISRKIDYGLRAMIYLASISQSPWCLPGDRAADGRPRGLPREDPEDARRPGPREVDARPARRVRAGALADRDQLLDVIEAVEGPVALNVCLDGEDACGHSTACTMVSVWRQGQERMLDVYRQAKLHELAFKPADNGQIGLVQLQIQAAARQV
jgi:DNA-binding IscR family transcriptional regulator